MNNILNYTIEFTIGLSVLYLIYFFLLRKETNYQFVRIYLLSSVLISAIFPLISFTSIQVGGVFIESPVALQEIVVAGEQTTVTNVPGFSWMNVLWGIYLIVTLLMFSKIVWQFIKIQNIKKGAQKSNYNGTDLYYTSKTGSTFTFLNAIFLDNKEDLNSEEREHILAHEQIHVKQLHTLDLLILEICRSIFWFNPVVHFYHAAIKITHEYQADHGVVKETSPSRYINLLVNQTLSNVGLSLGNHFGSPINNPIGFNKSKTLKRIEMMKMKNRKMNPVKYFIPVLAFALVFAVVSCDQNESTDAALESAVSELNEVDQKPEYNGGLQALYGFLGQEIKYPKSAREKGIEGKVFVEFVIGNDGAVVDVAVIKSTITQGLLDEMVVVGTDENSEQLTIQNAESLKLLEEEALRVVGAMPKWAPGKKDGLNVKVKMVVPIAFKLS